MKRIFQSIAITMFTLFATSFSCGQTGPTQPQVTLSWTQSSTPGITKNCIYRGTVSGTYQLPGTCIAPNTTYTDTTPVAGTTYFYAVTAQVGATESQYSVPAQAIVPLNPNAPTNLTPATITKNDLPGAIEVQAKVEWIKR